MDNEKPPPFQPELMSKDELVAMAHCWEEADRARIAHNIAFITKFSALVREFADGCIAITLQRGGGVEPGEKGH